MSQDQYTLRQTENKAFVGIWSRQEDGSAVLVTYLYYPQEDELEALLRRANIGACVEAARDMALASPVPSPAPAQTAVKFREFF